MINLLPPFAKKAIAHEYRVRVVTVALFFWSVSLLMVVVLASPIYVLIQNQIAGMQQTMLSAVEQETQVNEAIAQINSANAQARSLLSTAVEQPMMQYYNEIVALAGGGISIRQVTMRREQEVVSTIELQALSDTRQSLLAFIDRIQEHEQFGEVALPLASLARSQDIVFTVSIPVVHVDE